MEKPQGWTASLALRLLKPMPKPWPLVPLEEVLKPVSRHETVEPMREYRSLGVRLDGGGPFLRETNPGSQIASNALYRVKAGDFIYSRLFAWRGAFGVIPDELDDCYVSGEFPTFQPVPSCIDVEFLRLWFRLPTTLTRVEADCTGSTPLTHNRFKEEFFSALKIPLPPLNEQRRIVARIKQLAAKIDDARRVRKQVSDESFTRLRDAAFQRAFQGKVVRQDPRDEPGVELVKRLWLFKQEHGAQSAGQKEVSDPITKHEKSYPIPKTWEWVRLGDICPLITDGTHQTPRYVEEGMPFLSAQNVKPYRFMPESHRKVSLEDYFSYVAHAKPRKNDILMTRVGAMIGEAAIVDREFDFAIYVSLCLIRPFGDYVCVPYLVHWLNSPYGAASAREKTLGRGHSQGNLNLKLIKRFVLPLPPYNEQRRIVAYLDNLQAKADALKRLQTETAAELDALLPSILDRAFRGEL